MRLFQIVALASFALVIFKLIGLAADGAFEGLVTQEAVAQEQENSPIAENNPQSGDEKAVRELPSSNDGQIGEPGNTRESLLNRLGERRDALDKREEDLKLREELLKAAEKRLKAKLAKIQKAEGGDGGSGGKKAKEHLKDLVVIYESMKPKDAARIFDALSLNIMYQLASSINPRKMSGILAEMDVKAAERLTAEIAARALGKGNGKKKRALSKIGG